MQIKIRQTCRLCGEKTLTPVVNLGEQYLATFFVSKENENNAPTRKVPLELVRCNPQLNEKACGLVQLKHSYPPELMYAEYWYLSGVNQTMKNALTDISRAASEIVNLKKGDTVVDIGCNDGTLLKSYSVNDIDRIGFDPAQNVAKGFNNEPFKRVVDFFNYSAYHKINGEKKARVVTSIAMFYDLENPNLFTQDISQILDEEGVWILQMADLPKMLKDNIFDSICHEHVCYYHLAPLEWLFSRHGLKLIDIEKNDVNHSSYRLYIGKKERSTPITTQAQSRINKVRLEEFNEGYDTDAPYKLFCESIENNKSEMMRFLQEQKRKRKKVFVYGASTKGNVLLQYYNITNELVPFAAERNQKKWGLKTLGSNIPIISEEEARELKPDFFLVLPYHFMNEMLEREKEFTNGGGKFIVPVPQLQIIP